MNFKLFWFFGNTFPLPLAPTHKREVFATVPGPRKISSNILIIHYYSREFEKEFTHKCSCLLKFFLQFSSLLGGFFDFTNLSFSFYFIRVYILNISFHRNIIDGNYRIFSQKIRNQFEFSTENLVHCLKRKDYMYVSFALINRKRN